VSVLFGMALTFIGVVLGVAAGAVQGYFAGRTDLIPAPAGDLGLDAGAVPADHLLSIFQPSLGLLLVLLSLFGWMGLSDYVRADFLRNRNLDYVQAARAWACPIARSSGATSCPTA
jgi:microcin C transport system permease protein